MVLRPLWQTTVPDEILASASSTRHNTPQRKRLHTPPDTQRRSAPRWLNLPIAIPATGSTAASMRLDLRGARKARLDWRSRLVQACRVAFGLLRRSRGMCPRRTLGGTPGRGTLGRVGYPGICPAWSTKACCWMAVWLMSVPLAVLISREPRY